MIEVNTQDNNINILKADEIIKQFVDEQTSLEDQLTYIKQQYTLLERTEKCLIEINTNNWINMGKLLNYHKKKVISMKKTWERYIVEHFPFIKEIRRGQCMKLAEYIEIFPTVTKMYFLGFDRLYYFLTNAYDYIKESVALTGESSLNEIFSLFELVNESGDCEKSKQDFKTKVDRVIEYLKFNKNMEGEDFDSLILKDAITTGCRFKKSDYNILKSSDVKNINESLKKMIANGGSPSQRDEQPEKYESIIALLSRATQVIDRYINNNEITLDGLTEGLIDEIVNKLTTLKNRILPEIDYITSD